MYKSLWLIICLSIALSSCGGSPSGPPNEGNSSSSGGLSSSSSSGSMNVAQKVISGKVTFDFVPVRPGFHNGLDYDRTSQEPARGIVVEAVNASNGLISDTTTNEAGEFSLNVPQNTNVKIRARARLYSNAPGWDITVKDNTQNNAPFILNGSLADSGGATAQTRNLNAPSGWGSIGYSSERGAAPFAILDAIYDALQMLAQADD